MPYNDRPSDTRLLLTYVKYSVFAIKYYRSFILDHDTSSRGLLWQKLDTIVLEDSQPTIEHLQIPKNPLVSYIPEIIRNFRPKCRTSNTLSTSDMHRVIEDWLKDTADIINRGLKKSLELVIHMKGLHIIRQEALKLGISF